MTASPLAGGGPQPTHPGVSPSPSPFTHLLTASARPGPLHRRNPFWPALLLALITHALLIYALGFKPPRALPTPLPALEVLVLRPGDAPGAESERTAALADATQDGLEDGVTAGAPGQTPARANVPAGTSATADAPLFSDANPDVIPEANPDANTDANRDATSPAPPPDLAGAATTTLALDNPLPPESAVPPSADKTPHPTLDTPSTPSRPEPDRISTPPPSETAPTPSPQLVQVPAPDPAPAPDPSQSPNPAQAPSAIPRLALASPARPDPPLSAATILASRGEEIARLNAKLVADTAAFANRPRRKAISASTQEYRYASYLEAWRRKVEAIGNLNYPEEARKRKLYGNLILQVGVRADGSLEEVRVLRSSGSTLLDEAAVRIVHLAAPFAPFPPDIRQETDFLDITRTWQFLSNNRFGGKP